MKLKKQMKKLGIVLLTITMLLSFTNMTAFAADDPVLAGSGTESDPYKITNRAELLTIGNTTGQYYLLTNDIDLQKIRKSMAITFSGHLDGGGHTITGLTKQLIDATENASIKNLKIVFTGDATTANGTSTLVNKVNAKTEINNVQIIIKGKTIDSGMIGESYKGASLDIENCSVIVEDDGIIMREGTSPVVGGMIRHIRQNVNISNSFVYVKNGGMIKGIGKNATALCVGGLAGACSSQNEEKGSSSISNSYVINEGTISAEISADSETTSPKIFGVGGIIGSNYSFSTNCTIKNSYVYSPGSITYAPNSEYAGAVLGTQNQTTGQLKIVKEENVVAYTSGNLPLNGTPVTNHEVENVGSAVKTADEMKDSNTYSEFGTEWERSDSFGPAYNDSEELKGLPYLKAELYQGPYDGIEQSLDAIPSESSCTISYALKNVRAVSGKLTVTLPEDVVLVNEDGAAASDGDVTACIMGGEHTETNLATLSGNTLTVTWAAKSTKTPHFVEALKQKVEILDFMVKNNSAEVKTISAIAETTDNKIVDAPQVYTSETMQAEIKNKQSIPTADFDASTMKLTNVTSGMKYTVDGTTWTDIEGTEVDLSTIVSGDCTIKVVKKGNGTTTADSDAQEIVVTKAEMPAAPTLKAKTATSIEVNTVDGQEYRLGADGAWQTSGVFTGIDAYTDYEIYTRVAGKGTVLASDPSDKLAVKTECNHAQQRTAIDGKAATCTEAGYKAHYQCPCGKLFDAETGVNEIADLEAWKAGDGKIAAGHDWKESWESIEGYHWHACTKCDAKKDPSVHTPGAEATEDTPQICTVCGYIITPATGHIDHSHRTLVEGKAATCTVDGWKDYYKCNGNGCDKLFDAETDGNEIADLEAWKAGEGKIAAAHKLTKTDEVPATTTQYGVKAYWHCSKCDKYFSDAEGKTEIDDLDAWKQNEGRINKKSSGGGGGGSYTPIQKPVIEKNDNVKTELSSDGTKLTIKAEEGYEITDVLVNGVSKGAAGELTGLKTGDKVEIKTAKKAEPTQPTDPSTDKNAKLVKGIEDTSIILKSKLTENRKVLLTWTKSKGYKVDSYEVYRSVKKNSGYGKTAFFKTKDGNWSKYLNTKGLKAGKTYYYKVRGVRTIDGQKYYTQWSNKAWRTI